MKMTSIYFEHSMETHFYMATPIKQMETEKKYQYLWESIVIIAFSNYLHLKQD